MYKTANYYHRQSEQLMTELLEKEAGALTYARKINLPKHVHKKLIPHQMSHGALARRQARTAAKQNPTLDKLFPRRKRLMTQSEKFDKKFNAYNDYIARGGKENNFFQGLTLEQRHAIHRKKVLGW
jgi:hypothetical protein